jgi:hypothetical protein
MKKISIVLLVILSIHSYSQNKKNKLEFTSINSIGSVWGSSQNVVVFQTINGFNYKNWGIGLGVAFDGYGSQSTPIFLDLRRSITNDKKLFVYADAGVNIPWRTTNFPAKYSWNNEDAFKLKNTFYGEAGIGLKKQIVNKTYFVASLGYSFKQFSYIEQNVTTWGIGGVAGKTDYNYDFYYKRLALRLGIQF